MNKASTQPLYVVFHTTYHAIIIGLYRGADSLGTSNTLKKDSSKNLLLLVQQLLKEHNVTLRDCAFIGAHVGPGPFTTLRVTIASVNGLAFATQLPLVGVNGLEALLQENTYPTSCTIAILDAYCGDLYYMIQSDEHHEMGCAPFAAIIANPLVAQAASTTWIGNGVLLNKEKIEMLTRAHIPEPLPELCSIESVAQHALTAWQEQKNISEQLIPLYLKSGSAILGKTLS